MIGDRLGHYTVTSHLGTGGMGEVYQATDAKLGRSVAIKILPEAFSRDADRAVRFEREAKVLASLNHPNIAGIYGLEESGDTRFLVLELVEGDTLAERLARGAIPVDEALKLALQIAHALEAAHEKGIVHRDIKPANIKVTPDGKIKVLDFGLAKAFTPDESGVNVSNSPTMIISSMESMAATQQGMILGTASYMSEPPHRLPVEPAINSAAPLHRTASGWPTPTLRRRSGFAPKPFPPTGVIHEVTQDGDAWPVWSSAGEIFFRLRRDATAPVQLRAMDVSTDGAFTFRNPRSLQLPANAIMYQGYRDYDVTRGGDKFVIIVPEQKDAWASVTVETPRIDVVLNWVEELKLRVPAP